LASKEFLEGANQLAEVITNEYPQINKQGLLNYYFAGSLAPMLLAKAEKIEQIITTHIPSIRIDTEIILPEKSKKYLQKVARPMADIDYIQTNAEKEIPQFGNYISELPEKAKNTLSKSKQNTIAFDKVEVFGQHRINKVTIKEKEFFISDLMQTYNYKILHATYVGHKKKFIKELNHLHIATSAIYKEEAIYEELYQLLKNYEKKRSNFAPSLGRLIKGFLNNASYD